MSLTQTLTARARDLGLTCCRRSNESGSVGRGRSPGASCSNSKQCWASARLRGRGWRGSSCSSMTKVCIDAILPKALCFYVACLQREHVYYADGGWLANGTHNTDYKPAVKKTDKIFYLSFSSDESIWGYMTKLFGHFKGIASNFRSS